ncbi:hypothetical protein [Fuscovulum blasticum]|uniref:hypothetical protein n=1 Tax=Fuscovulum blasticum TaxID=1075 RepID=UPI000D3EB69C|nr:hypothetical protein [Fuscovulum blasticum]AWD20817.1 hypothetical protein B6K69_03350 [Fuscovulum blasticum]
MAQDRANPAFLPGTLRGAAFGLACALVSGLLIVTGLAFAGRLAWVPPLPLLLAGMAVLAGALALSLARRGRSDRDRDAMIVALTDELAAARQDCATLQRWLDAPASVPRTVRPAAVPDLPSNVVRLPERRATRPASLPVRPERPAPRR